MVKVPVVELTKTGPRLATRNVPKSELGSYRKLKFRGKTVRASPKTVTRIRREGAPDHIADQTRKLLPAPRTEEFFVRDDHSGGFTRKTKKGKSSRVKIDFSVQVTGTQEQRDAAYEKLESLFTEKFPFLERKGRIGRHDQGRAKKGTSRVRVTKSKFNDRESGTAARAMHFELLEELE